MTHTHDYPVPPTELLDALADPDYLAARHERFGGVGAPTAELSNPDIVITTVRQLPMDKIPSAIKGLVGDGKITQVDTWSAAAGRRRRPARNLARRPRDGSCRHRGRLLDRADR